MPKIYRIRKFRKSLCGKRGRNNTLNNNLQSTNNKNKENLAKLDETDNKIIQLLLGNHESFQISKRLGIPQSTIQRRIRKLFEKKVIAPKIELNYEMIGYKRGMLHLYLARGSFDKVGKAIAEKPGVLSVSVHIGNSDLVAFFVYKNSQELLEIITNTKQIEGVEKVLWSEEVYFIYANENKPLIENLMNK